ncbi:MAG: hypothetical protein RMJ28_03330 [Nitrososphaerota archaeon]|nr:hypothetical protein [Candidatus Calditenuaceae archaeon]MDW8073252.1 hypothetical protein [Nitrososphaerota archaeon]
MANWDWASAGGSERRLETLRCEVCRGVAKNCSLMKCPYYRGTIREALKAVRGEKVVFGPTPPTVLVGEWGYPRVYVGTGLVLSPELDFKLLESPGSWLSKPLDELLYMRLSILLGRSRAGVKLSRSPPKILDAIQESSASQKPVDLELKLSSSVVRFVPGFGVRHAPHGPAGTAEYIRLVDNPSIPRPVDRVIGDPFMPVLEAVERLTSGGVDEYYIVRLLSSGLLGRRIDRKLVPTEWSITAVDDMLGKMALRRVKSYRIIGEFRLHSFSALHNAAHIILTPTPWMFELLEGWVKSMEVYSDHELTWGRTSYAENTGGAYYACRLPILTHLERLKAQSGAIVFFEVDEGWIPLGVWRFREIVRAALKERPVKCGSLAEALELIKDRLRLGLQAYLRRSLLTTSITRQTKLYWKQPPP